MAHLRHKITQWERTVSDLKANDLDANNYDANSLDNCEVSADLASLWFHTADGPSLVLTAEKLRSSCKCAHCIRARIDERFPKAFRGIAIVGVSDLGYGLNIAFSDGHDRGIYPKAYLAGLATA
jgi:DUF971 family protein